MTRDNEIANAASEAMTETLMSCPMYEFSPKATDLLECAYIKGAEWADEHPASPWHSVADGDFPLKAKNNNRIEFSVEVLVLLNKNRLAFGRYDYTYKSWYVGLQRVYPTHWAEIPKLPEK